MYCPSCRTLEHSDVHFKTDAFQEDFSKCSSCGTVWSTNHGTIEIVTDTLEKSFLSARTECVECDDYNLAFAGH
jgi:uncharacterized Zn finger protein